MSCKMYVVILYSYNKSEPYVYDVVDNVEEVINKFGAVQFGEHSDDIDNMDENGNDFLRLIDIDTSYKWYHISEEKDNYYKSLFRIDKIHKNIDMMIVEKKNYTLSEIMQDEMLENNL